MMIISDIKKSVLFVLFFITACATSEILNVEVKMSVPPTIPVNVLIGDNIRLSFPKNHPKNLAIQTPAGTWYSIQSSGENVFVIPVEKYNVATELLLKTQILEGITWKNGIKVKEKIFQDVGEYLIYMANNLETEPENTFHFMVKVKLIKEKTGVKLDFP